MKKYTKTKPLSSRKSGEVRSLSAKEIALMRPASEVLPKNLLKTLEKRKVGQRGPQKTPTKISVTLRYSPEVIAYFKSTGDGWQKKMDNALKEWIKNHKNIA